MKLSLSFGLLATISAVNGFAPATFGLRNSRTQLNSVTRPDASEAIKAALEASKKFGPTSPEARTAWETVEELDSADTSPATAGSLNEECLTEEEASKACMEYGKKLDELSEILKEQSPYLEKMKGLASELRKIKLAAAPAQAAKDSPELRAAVKAAKEASAKFGATSPEARVAWDTVEEIASAGVDPALGGMLDDDCLVEALEACEALDEFNKVLSQQKS